MRNLAFPVGPIVPCSVPASVVVADLPLLADEALPAVVPLDVGDEELVIEVLELDPVVVVVVVVAPELEPEVWKYP